MKRRLKKLLLTTTCLLVVLGLCGQKAGSQTPPYSPGNDQGFFVVENAYQQFEALKHHGEALGWTLPEYFGAPDPSVTDHYQGLARYPGDGVPVFYVTQLDDDDPILPGASDKGGYLHLVKFGSRPTTGERLRSNLQKIGTDTEDTYPPFTPTVFDSWYRSIRFDGSLVVDSATLIYCYSIDPNTGELICETGTVWNYELPAYNHPGSMAIVDDILFVPLDTRRQDEDPIGFIVLFDLRENGGSRENPVPIHAIMLTHKIDNLAVTRYGFGDGDGTKYLVWVNGDGGKETKFYKTTSSNLRDDTLGLEEVQDWDSNSPADYDGAGHDWPGGQCAHQSSTFLREPDGSLYMIGMRHGHPCYDPRLGPDYADLFKVEPKPSPSEGFKITVERWERELFCAYQGGGGAQHMRICNFAAANNAYVSPSGELILYSIPHNDEDWANPDFVRLAEFRHRDVNREGSPLRLPTADSDGPYTVDEGDTVILSGIGGPPADRPWVELYDDKYFLDRSIVVDFDDKDDLELFDFSNLDDFNDKTSSVRWRAPPGVLIGLYDDKSFDDRFIVLYGTGDTEEIYDLDSQLVVPGLVEHYRPFKFGKLEFNDKTSSLFFGGSMPTPGNFTLDWDLDGDNAFGETGAAATRGDEVGDTPIFSAADLDGPDKVNVTLRVTSSSTSSTGTDMAVIDVVNVPPVVSIDSITDETGAEIGVDVPDAIVGQTVSLTGRFTDPGTQDTHTAQVDWDDGTVDDLGAVAGTISASHIFSAPVQFTVALTVTDDDGGEGSATRQISVREPSSSELIDGILTFFDESAEAGTLEGVGHRSWLAKCRLRFMRIVLNLAKKFIERDRTKAACHMLKRAYKRCDSERRPSDFVCGEATAELASMIQAARESMGCKMKH
jgi:hypothetical protein